MNADPNSEPEPGSEAARINETYGVQATNKWKTPKSERDAKAFLFQRILEVDRGQSNWFTEPRFTADDIENIVRENGAYTDAFLNLFNGGEVGSRPIDALKTRSTRNFCDSLKLRLVSSPGATYITDQRPAPVPDPPLPTSELISSWEELESIVKRNSSANHTDVEIAMRRVAGSILAVRDRVNKKVNSVPRSLNISDVADGFRAELMKANSMVVEEQQRLMANVDGHVDRFLDTMGIIEDTVACLTELFRSEMGGGRAAVNENFMKQLGAVIKLLDHLEKTTTVIAVMGETSSGKTTLVSGIISSKCMPVADDANTACPIRIIVKKEAPEPTLFLPASFRKRLNHVYDRIWSCVRTLVRLRIPTEVQPGIMSQTEMSGALDLYNRIVVDIADDFNEWDRSLPPPAFGDEPIVGEDNICEKLNFLNSLMRLAYGLKHYTRFKLHGLADMDPIGRLVDVAGDKLLDYLPVIYARCSCTEQLPVLGQLSFIDTPGTSERGGAGTLTLAIERIVDAVLRRSDRVLCLTTPTSRTGTIARQLISRVVKVVGSRAMVVVNKFDDTITKPAGTTLEDILQRYRIDHRDNDGLPANNVQWLQARVLYLVELGRSSVVGSKASDEPVTISDIENSSKEAQLLVNQTFGSAWKKMISKSDFNVEFFNETIRAEAAKSNFGNVLGMCLLPTFIRALAELPRTYVKEQIGFFTGVLRSLNTRLAVTQSNVAKEEVIELLLDTVREIEKLEIEKIELENLVRERMRISFRNVVMSFAEELKLKTIESITAVEMACEKSAPVSVGERYSVGDKDDNGKEIYVRVNYISTVAFATKEAALNKRTAAIKAVEDVLAASAIEKDIEIVREFTFKKSIQEACSDLNTKLQLAWSKTEDSPNHDRSLLIDKEMIAEAQRHREKLDTVKSLLETQVTALQDKAHIETVEHLKPSISGGVYPEEDYVFYFFKRTRYRVLFEALRGLVGAIIDIHYEIDHYCNAQITRGDEALTVAMASIFEKLAELRLEVLELIEIMQHDIEKRDIVALEILTASASELLQKYCECEVGIEQSVALIEASEAV